MPTTMEVEEKTAMNIENNTSESEGPIKEVKVDLSPVESEQNPKTDAAHQIIDNGQQEQENAENKTSQTVKVNSEVAEGTSEEGHPDSAAGVEEFKPSALAKEKLRYCATIFKGLKRHPQSSPFQTPVDPIALNIPDYFTIIAHPMDLSSIGKKLDSNEYTDADAFIADVRLMLDNCFRYNHPDSQVTKMGRSLEKYFNVQVSKIPTTLPAPGSEQHEHRRKSEHAPATPLTAARARRESHAPNRLTTTPAGSTTPRARARSSANPDLAFCNTVLRELLKKANQSVVWPFVEPVDPVKLGIPDYFDVIQQPMDLSTVRRKLDSGQYSSADQFETDIRRIISNCYTYNTPGSDVVKICQGFEQLFNSKWSQRHAATAVSSSGNGGAHYDDDDSDSEKILEINRKIQALQQELNTLLMKRKTRPSHHHVAAGRPKKSSVKPTTSTPKAPPKTITEEEFFARPMSYDEKRQLSNEVNNLSPEKLGKVVEIIQAGMALEAQGDSDVIELDIESLNVRTLRQLQKYVMECKGITSLTAIIAQGEPAGAKRKKSTATGSTSATKKAAATSGGTAPSTAAEAAAVAMSSEDESSDEDLD